MRVASHFGQALLLAGLCAVAVVAEDLAALRQKLARETDPAERAKITVKIGEELLDQISNKYDEGAYSEADQLLGDYMAATRAAHQGLRESGRDARRKPKGFKQMEIHLRKARRRLEDMARRLPFDQRALLDEAALDIEILRVDLLHALMKVEPKLRNQNKKEEQQP